MTDKKRDRLRRQSQEKHDRAIAEAKAMLERELSAIDVICKMEAEAGHSNGTDGQRTSDLTAKVMTEAASIGGRFSAEDIELRLRGQGLNGALSRKSVANVLDREVRKPASIIRIAEKGEGRRATFYEKVPDDTFSPSL